MQEDIAKKEKILEMHRSRSRDRSASKPSNALNQPTKVEIKNYKPASPKQAVKFEAVNQGYYKPEFEKGDLNTYLKSEKVEVNTDFKTPDKEVVLAPVVVKEEPV